MIIYSGDEDCNDDATSGMIPIKIIVQDSDDLDDDFDDDSDDDDVAEE